MATPQAHLAKAYISVAKRMFADGRTEACVHALNSALERFAALGDWEMSGACFRLMTMVQNAAR
jgi:hypothetical protein